MADLNTNYESAQMKLDTQNKILEMTKRSLEEYMNKYERERDNCRKLQTELSLLKGQSDQIENYKKQLDYYKLNEAKLQEELNDLRISPFIKQAEERGNVYRNLQITQKKLTETKKNLDEKEKKLNEAELKLGSLERENEELKRSLNLEKIDKEKYKEESLKLKITRIEREKSDKLFQDKLNKYNQYGEINSDFTNLLSIYKRQNDELNWANINFIEPELLKEKNPDILLKENERLRLEKTALGKELENAKNSLLIQQQINTEFKKEKDYENEKNKSEIKLLKNKIEELCKLIDIKNTQKDYNNLSQTNNLTQTYKFPKTMPLVQKPNLLEEKSPEESQEETEVELTINENALDVYFGECIYEDDLEEKIGYNIDDMLSFFSVDFYMHETQTSDILSGKNPMFNFQILFKVDVNEGLLSYLKNEYMTIQVYSLRDEVQIILGEGKIGLNDLLNYNPNL
jgi:protein fantom